MAEITWIKLNTDMFENDKIRLIEKLPDADTILIIWVKLLAHAGKANAGGYIMLTENVPLSTEDLATLFNRPLNTVRLALETFKRYRMIEISEDDAIRIKNWDVYQNLESMEKVREQNRLRKQRQRAREKQLPEPQKTPSQQDNEHENVTSRDSHATDKEREKEDKDKDKKTSCRANKFDDTQMELAKKLLTRIQERDPNYRQPNLDKWANDIRLMMERDNRPYNEIDKVIDWCQDDAFWHKNILSTGKLREQFS
ncbi:MAG: hypothetical protein K0Q56_1515, partial [Sporolactobacillus laevolacticus]|nr:hypothetical protein [Sporolactobacillus laevolacticus]